MTTVIVDSLARYETLKAKRAELAAELTAAAKDAFRVRAQSLFNAHPDLAEFSWKQYTPYFNDGDECVFSAKTDYPDLRMTDEGERTYWWRDSRKDETPRDRAGEDVKNFFGAFGDDDLKEMFGDHTEILVTRDGVEVLEYEHE